MAFYRTHNSETHVSESIFDVNLEIQNDGYPTPINFASSIDPSDYDNFNITIDQLEGEINVPYQYVDQNVNNVVTRKIIVPDSILGGFGQWRINYTYIQYPDQQWVTGTAYQGTFIAGSIDTERITVPKIVYDPDVSVGVTTFTFDKNTIREAFADKIYQSFFLSLSEIPSDIGDLKSLQTTIRDGFITTGRSEDEKLVFYKKDRNTPENIKDFNEGTLSLIITDISSSLSFGGAGAGPQDIDHLLDDELTIVGPTIGDRTASDETNDNNDPLYYYESTTYELRYKNDNMKIPFASYNTFYVDSGATDALYEPKPDVEWTNVFNLSQLTTPNLSGKRVKPEKAREVLDTSIFELLPNQRTRQDDINEFFSDFNDLIGGAPVFDDVDFDGVGEKLITDVSRISTAPNDPSAYITRTDEDATQSSQNQDKTLESMRNRLNQYLGDVDNVVTEIQDERPEYENKSEGFLKIRKPNQAIIIRDMSGGELEFQKSDSFLTDGFTITQWVRFVGKTGGGTLFSFGNPYKGEDAPTFDRYGFRLETFTEQNDNDDYERFVRLVVWDHINNKLYDSHFGIQDQSRVNTHFSLPYPKYPHFKYNYLQIPTDDLSEWYFICATYDPSINEGDSITDSSYANMLTNRDFWLNHLDVAPSPPTGDAIYTAPVSFFQVTFTSTITVPHWQDISMSQGIARQRYIGRAIKITYGGTNYIAGISSINRIQNQNQSQWLIRLSSTPGSTDFADIFNPTIPDNSDITFQIGDDEGTPFFVSNSGLGAKCKVEAISRSELLRARGYKVDKFDIPLEQG